MFLFWSLLSGVFHSNIGMGTRSDSCSPDLSFKEKERGQYVSKMQRKDPCKEANLKLVAEQAYMNSLVPFKK